jgi:hypothetical protein
VDSLQLWAQPHIVPLPKLLLSQNLYFFLQNYYPFFLFFCRNPKAFLEGLLERFNSAAGSAQLAAPAGAESDQALLLSAAAVAFLQANVPLGDHAAALGYVDKLVRVVAARWEFEMLQYLPYG